jgi:hypothetical protein
MKVGHARFCLTPQNRDFYLDGYAKKDTYAKGVHDDIFCNAILFHDDSGNEVFIWSADVIEFEESMAEDTKTLLNEKFGISRDLVLLCATHNHSSIGEYQKFGFGQENANYNPQYFAFFLGAIVKSFETCRENMREASCVYGKETVEGWYGNRNHADRLADNEIIVMKFLDQDGKAFAGIINWAVHATVIGPGSEYLTGELPENVCVKLEKSWGFFPAFVLGAAGDCSNRNQRQGNDFAELERVSTGLAAAIEKIAVNTPVKFGAFGCQTLIHTVHHNMKTVHEGVGQTLEEAQKKLQGETNYDKIRHLGEVIRHCKEVINITSYHCDIRMSVIQMGGFELFVFPSELGSKLGMDLKKAFPGLALVLTCVNGHHGYWMQAESYGDSMETAGTGVLKGEPEKIIAKMIQSSGYLRNSL